MEVIHNLLFTILLWTSIFQSTHELDQTCPDFGLTAVIFYYILSLERRKNRNFSMGNKYDLHWKNNTINIVLRDQKNQIYFFQEQKSQNVMLFPMFGCKVTNKEEIIRKHNYTFEKHIVQTEDGYILEVHRILPNTKFRNNTKNVIPVLIFSGLFGDSATWVSLGPKNGLGFILADHGYDVWMGNNRGSTLCKNHVYLDPYKDQKEFWNFSFQELGYYDIPATVDYTLNVTKQEKLLYIGFSQSTTSYFAMLSERPNYNNKIKFAVALAPITSMQNCLSVPTLLLIKNLKSLKGLMESQDMYELFPHSSMILLAIQYCYPNSNYMDLCAEVICSVFYATMAQLNKSTIPLIISNSPAGASVKEAYHLLQLGDGIFRKYDYGIKGNLENYGQADPPLYNLSKVNVPTALIYGSSDVLATQKDVELLAPKLPNLVGMKLIPKFNHIDLSFGIDAPTLVFTEILNFLNIYS